jgi:hypothetical protein
MQFIGVSYQMVSARCCTSSHRFSYGSELPSELYLRYPCLLLLALLLINSYFAFRYLPKRAPSEVRRLVVSEPSCQSEDKLGALLYLARYPPRSLHHIVLYSDCVQVVTVLHCCPFLVNNSFVPSALAIGTCTLVRSQYPCFSHAV